MSRLVAMLAALGIVVFAGAARAQCGGGAAGHSDHATSVLEGEAFAPRAWRSPGLAAALSLTPVPVDFGNLYAERIGWGMTYTTVELALATSMVWLAADRGMGHSGTATSWSAADRNWMVGLVAGYVAVKVAAGLHAAHNAEVFNRDQGARRFSAAVLPTSGGGLAVAAVRF